MSFLSSNIMLFQYYKKLGDKMLEQLSFQEVKHDYGGNSIAIITKHLSGNMKSRRTNFLKED